MEQQFSQSIPQPPSLSEQYRSSNVSEEHLLKPSVIAATGEHPAGPLHPVEGQGQFAGQPGFNASEGTTNVSEEHLLKPSAIARTGEHPAGPLHPPHPANAPLSAYGEETSFSQGQQFNQQFNQQNLGQQRFDDTSSTATQASITPARDASLGAINQGSFDAPLARTTSQQDAGAFNTAPMAAALPAAEGVVHPSLLGTQSYFVPLDSKTEEPAIQPIEATQFAPIQHTAAAANADLPVADAAAVSHDDVIPSGIASRVVGLPEAAASNLGGTATLPATGSPTYERRALTGERLVPTRIEKDALEALNPNADANLTRGAGYQTTNPSSLSGMLLTNVDANGQPINQDAAAIGTDADYRQRAEGGSISGAQAAVDRNVNRSYGAADPTASGTSFPTSNDDMRRADTTTIGAGNTLAGDIRLMTQSDSKPYQPWPNPMQNAGQAQADRAAEAAGFAAGAGAGAGVAGAEGEEYVAERDRSNEPNIALVPSMNAPPRRIVNIERAEDLNMAAAPPATIYSDNEAPRLPVLGQDQPQAAAAAAAPLSMPYPAREEVELVSPGHLGQSDRRVVHMVPDGQGGMTGHITNPPY